MCSVPLGLVFSLYPLWQVQQLLTNRVGDSGILSRSSARRPHTLVYVGGIWVCRTKTPEKKVKQRAIKSQNHYEDKGLKLIVRVANNLVVVYIYFNISAYKHVEAYFRHHFNTSPSIMV